MHHALSFYNNYNKIACLVKVTIKEQFSPHAKSNSNKIINVTRHKNIPGLLRYLNNSYPKTLSAVRHHLSRKRQFQNKHLTSTQHGVACISHYYKTCKLRLVHVGIRQLIQSRVMRIFVQNSRSSFSPRLGNCMSTAKSHSSGWRRGRRRWPTETRPNAPIASPHFRNRCNFKVRWGDRGFCYISNGITNRSLHSYWNRK